MFTERSTKWPFSCQLWSFFVWGFIGRLLLTTYEDWVMLANRSPDSPISLLSSVSPTSETTVLSPLSSGSLRIIFPKWIASFTLPKRSVYVTECRDTGITKDWLTSTGCGMQSSMSTWKWLVTHCLSVCNQLGQVSILYRTELEGAPLSSQANYALTALSAATLLYL